MFPGLLGRSFNLLSGKDCLSLWIDVCCVRIHYRLSICLTASSSDHPRSLCRRSFAALVAIGHLQNGGLGAAYGSFFAASLIWCALTLPVRRFSVIGLFAQSLSAPIISGVMILLVIIQISNVALPNWIGLPSNSGLRAIVNILIGNPRSYSADQVHAVGRHESTPRSNPVGPYRGHIKLCDLPANFVCSGCERAPILVTPKWFPFGFAVQTDLVIVFLLVLIPQAWAPLQPCTRWLRTGETKTFP